MIHSLHKLLFPFSGESRPLWFCKASSDVDQVSTAIKWARTWVFAYWSLKPRSFFITLHSIFYHIIVIMLYFHYTLHYAFLLLHCNVLELMTFESFYPCHYSTHMQDLKDITSDIHYENYRAEHLAEQMKQSTRERMWVLHTCIKSDTVDSYLNMRN